MHDYSILNDEHEKINFLFLPAYFLLSFPLFTLLLGLWSITALVDLSYTAGILLQDFTGCGPIYSGFGSPFAQKDCYRLSSIDGVPKQKVFLKNGSRTLMKNLKPFTWKNPGLQLNRTWVPFEEQFFISELVDPSKTKFISYRNC